MDKDIDGLQTPFGMIVGRCPQMQRLFRAMKLLACKPKTTVLIRGESGTGKRLVARAIHYLGSLRSQPFIEIDCAAVPTNLLESELFGYERGAYMEPHQHKKGLLELAGEGTFFLNEIGALSLELQQKLMQAIERMCFRRVHGTQDVSISMRVMAASSKSLESEVEKGTFRRDFFHRLNAITLTLPPLRQRGEDILLLSRYFIATLSRENNRPVQRLSTSAERMLLEYTWPGNVRELKNVIARAIAQDGSEYILPEHLALGCGHIVSTSPTAMELTPKVQVKIPTRGIPLHIIEKRIIQKALELTQGNVSRAARLLRLSRETMRYRIQKLGVGR